jgi:AraC-like DNA-binding protein
MEKTTEKNTASGSFDETLLEDGFSILTSKNDFDLVQELEKDIDSSYIQFHFCLKGSAEFKFNQGNYTLTVVEDHSLLLYNPQLNLPIHLDLQPKSWLVSLVISIDKFHHLFSDDANYVSFLTEENRNKKYYKEHHINPSMAVVLNQMLGFNLNQSVKPLYFKAKGYELLSLFFNKDEDADLEQCPFLVDEENVAKLRKAKDIVIARMAEPPSLQELSESIGLSLKKLKEGFKQIYGDTVYGFLLDYKMEVARKLLDSGEYNVNEVGFKVGYSTSSHFIAAFKKKYGTTPKKYIQASVK